MTARSSSISLAIALLAGCYDQPDLEIAVTRDPPGATSGTNVTLYVCRDAADTKCKSNSAFPPGEDSAKRTVFIFIEDDLPSILVKVGDMYCVQVVLGDDTVKRSLSLLVQPHEWSAASEMVPCQ